MKKLFVMVIFFTIACLTQEAAALCVNVPEANLRSGPGTKYEKTWMVYKYMPFKKIKQQGSWIKVEDVDGDRHWIYKKLVTSRIRCAVVKAKKANIRSGPGTQYSKSSEPAVKYDSFKVLKKKSSWVKVVDEFGISGWIFRKLLWIQ
jgi:SH3-like domain-containing protein